MTTNIIYYYLIIIFYNYDIKLKEWCSIMRSRKILTRIVSGTPGNRPDLRWTQVRRLGTAPSLVVMHNENPAVVLINTFNDAINESYEDYKSKSFVDLANHIPKQMRNRDLLFVKINQTALNPDKPKDQPFAFGHIAAVVGRCSDIDDSFTFRKDSLICKTRKALFEKQDEYISSRLITDHNKVSEPATLDYPVKEFIIVIDPEQIGLNLEQYCLRVNELIREGAQWDALRNACGQAFYKALTGRELGPDKSPQTAFVYGMFELTKTNPILTDLLREGMVKLNINKNGYDVGHTLIQYQQHKEESKDTDILSSGSKQRGVK